MENPPAYSTYEQSATNPEYTTQAPVYQNYNQPQVGGNDGVPGTVYTYPGQAHPGQPVIIGTGVQQPTAVVVQPSCYTNTGHVHCSTNSYIQSRRNQKCVCVVVIFLFLLPIVLFLIIAGATGLFSGKWS